MRQYFAVGTFRKLARFSGVGILLFLLLPVQVSAGVGENLRTALDLSIREGRSHGENWAVYALGLDVHKVFSSSAGDIGTLTFQPYLVHIHNTPFVPTIFEDNHDSALQWRIANFNYTGIGHGRFNIRIGHFELPFGLEQVVQSNGTLNQVNASRAASLKADWGVSINGTLPKIEYELALMQGSGNDFASKADGLVVGRIGLVESLRWWVGVSALRGEIATLSGVQKRRRYAVDAGLVLSHGFSVMSELAVGEDAQVDVQHFFSELSWSNRSEQFFSYLQWRYSKLDEAHSDRINVGVRYEPNVHWSVSLELFQDVDPPAAKNKNETLMVQWRYRL